MILRIVSLALVTVATLLVACSSTMITGSWVDPGFSGKVE